MKPVLYTQILNWVGQLGVVSEYPSTCSLYLVFTQWWSLMHFSEPSSSSHMQIALCMYACMHEQPLQPGD